MQKAVFLLNAVLTIPFGLAALIAPAAVFARFGLALDPAATLVARGYAAACLGLGVVFALSLNVNSREATTALLAGSLAFNAVEVAVQGAAWLDGTAGGAVWLTVLAHAVALVLTVLCLARRA